MKTTLMTQVTNSIFEVMETMFFMTLEEVDPSRGVQPPPAELVCSAITFSGEFSGTIYLEIPSPLLKSMTEDFMGQPLETLSNEYIQGTLKEALNMVAGNALTLVDATVYMGLGIPEIVPSPDPSRVDETVVLTTGQEMVLAHVKLN